MLLNLDSLERLLHQCTEDPGLVRVNHSECGKFIWVHLSSDPLRKAPYAIHYKGREIQTGFGTYKELLSFATKIAVEKIKRKHRADH